MKPLSLICLAGALTLATLAQAADAAFDAADQNGDGVLSSEEVSAAMPDVSSEAFDAADEDASGTLTEDEFLAAIEKGLLPRG